MAVVTVRRSVAAASESRERLAHFRNGRARAFCYRRAGLNLRWDHYYYEGEGASWGDPASPVRLAGAFSGRRPPLDVPATVVERAGCDVAPLDPSSPQDCLTLLAYIWPDQVDRIELLRGALLVARRVPAPVDAADAPQWLQSKLKAETPGVATVVFHSIVTPFLTDLAREKLQTVLARAGERATRMAPLAWLRMEPGEDQADVRLTMWPGGVERLVATAGFHGRPVHWLA